MVGIGIDIGSTAAKAAVVETDNAIAWTCVMPTGYSSVDAAERLRGELAAAGYDVTGDDVRVIATGYGRVAVPYAHKVVTEITCHGTGAVRLFGDHGTVIDVGGQDTKVIQLKSGRVAKFAMNDKCAAGTGRFYEAMARSFEMSLPEFSNLSLTAKNVIPITAQCTVFAESEVITLVGEGKPMDEIAAGIQMAVAKRCFVMSKKAGATDAITLTGGCAKNAGLKKAIEHVLKLKVIDLKTDPQLMGALGAAEYARQKGMARA